MKRLWQVGNIFALFFALAANFLVSAQILDVPAINEISDMYATLLTPATYAFSIWSIIYILLIIFVLHQARDITSRTPTSTAGKTLPEKIGPYFIIASICNGLWTYVFVQQWIALSVAILTVLTVSLYVLIWKAGIGLADAKRREVICVWWPILLYTGWVTVATLVNISSWLESLNLMPSPVLSAGVLVLLATALCYLLTQRSVRELLLASAWGVVAIGVQQLGTRESMLVAYVSFAVGATLVVAIAMHAYKNRRNMLPR